MHPAQLGEEIKRLRVKRRLSQAQLAQRAKVSTVFIYKVEAGERMPSWETLDRITRVLWVKARLALVPSH